VIRAAREQARLTGDEVAYRLRRLPGRGDPRYGGVACSQGSVSKIENALVTTVSARTTLRAMATVIGHIWVEWALEAVYGPRLALWTKQLEWHLELLGRAVRKGDREGAARYHERLQTGMATLQGLGAERDRVRRLLGLPEPAPAQAAA
jgi:hypothetical protein